MRLLWEDRAWNDYLYWQVQDRKTLKRINTLIGEIKRTPLFILFHAEGIMTINAKSQAKNQFILSPNNENPRSLLRGSQSSF